MTQARLASEETMKFHRAILILGLALTALPAAALTFSQIPLFIASTEPRIMLVASRDHQLSIKAYTDYSDLDGDGQLDTTYKDNITYAGYFDSDKCYTYSDGNSRYEPSAAVTSGTHQCNGSTWSGNFLNWATMTRMDILRKTFYGGYRSTDTTSATVLERHFLPVDVHAFVKVFNPGSSATLSLYMPSTVVGANTSISLCNVSDSTNTNVTGKSSFTIPAPSIKVAAGAWPQWDSSEVTQCAVGIGNSTQPTSLIGTYTARVQVCVSGMLESNCKTYTHPTTGVQTVKPIGLLQTYGDVDADKRVRFGLMTGSYGKNKSGGVLRKNATYISNNSNNSITSSSVCGNNHSDDEIDVCTGQFINQASNQAGIINTLNRLHIAGFQYTSAGKNGKHQYSCNSPGITSFSDGQCVDWGNPLSEIYQEALKYFAGLGPTSAYNAFSGTNTDTSILSSIPMVTWADPLPATEWCALSSIVVLSTGLNSFDTDQLSSFTSGSSTFDATALTQTVGDSSHENINGGSYLIGGNGVASDNQCTAKTVSNLATAKGICPEVPSLEGGYGIAGLAYGPKILDLRPGYATQRAKRWTGINADWVARQPINTYAVQLAESLPSFSAKVGGGTVTLLPACQANSTAGAAAWPGSTGWRNCSMTNLIVDTNVAMAAVGSDATAKTNTCSGNGTTSQCFTVAWEDSTWGNDYDMDGIQRLGYCVGGACSTFKMLCPSTASATATLGPWTVGASAIVIATCAVQANAGHALTFGYTVTGTTNDGAFFPILRPGGANFNVGSVLAAGITAPNAATFSQGPSAASLLKNPLWYAAKYGGFTESTPAAGTPNPNLTSEWDAKINATGQAGSDGIPDNYFDVKNPANLAAAMATIFDAASQPDASAASVATNTTTLQTKTRVFQAKFSSADWSGQLLSYPLDQVTGALGTPDWDAGSVINGQNYSTGRVILTKGSSGGVPFLYGSLTGAAQTSLNQDKSGTVDNCGPERVSYLRGDATHESATGTFACASATTINNFRVRSSKLGDIINSNPWYVGAPAAGYSDVDYPGYSVFRKGKLNRDPVVYVAANDGMLHGINAKLDFTSNPAGVVTAASGKEVLAYVPSGAYAKLNRLPERTYNKDHQYVMDGSPLVGDADVAADGTSTYTPDWRSVLVGGLGAGGIGYYALDVSDPSVFSQSGTAPAHTLLWEFTDADDADMGFAFNHPPTFFKTNYPKQMVRMANGKWAVILGNGYNSASGKAVLYILFIKEGMDGTWTLGTDYIKIVADGGPNNGLSTPVPYDMDGDGVVDVVYAGDLKGNMWKFLVGDVNPSNWQVDFSTATCGATSPTTCVPLFTATDASSNPQPILWPAEVTTHPSGTGTMVLFGTGQFLESGDVSTTSVQTYYGVWDNNDALISTVGTPAGTRASGLTQLSVSTGSQTVNGVTYPTRTVTGTAGSSGWYLDLPISGERATGIPKLSNGILFFNTFIPSSSPCDAGGTGWLMALNYYTGLTPTHQVFADFGTTPLAGVQFGAALGGTTLIQSSTSNQGFAVMSLTKGNIATEGDGGVPKINFGARARGRMTWREIVQ
jgi:type IV pilus assembly protein PilY1